MEKKYLPLILGILMVISNISCEQSNGNYGSNNGTGGSTARFAIQGDHLYAVNNTSMNLFDISNPDIPTPEDEEEIGFGIETIFSKDSLLFIGSRSGMYIYDISQPTQPQLLSQYSHINSCDPVVVEGKYAFVTLRTNDTWCGNNTNELQVVDISDLKNPILVKQYPMKSPFGLGIKDGKLYVCDDGLKIFDAKDVNKLQLLQHIKIDATDVIPLRRNLLVTGRNGLYQYDCSGDTLTQLSHIQAFRTE